MMAIINQIRRLGYDNGSEDRDFSDEEVKLQIAKTQLDKAIAEFSRAAQNLYDVLLLERKPLLSEHLDIMDEGEGNSSRTRQGE